MADSMKYGLPPALSTKIESFTGSLTPEEVAQMRRQARESAGTGIDQHAAKGTAPERKLRLKADLTNGNSAPFGVIDFDLPAS